MLLYDPSGKHVTADIRNENPRCISTKQEASETQMKFLSSNLLFVCLLAIKVAIEVLPPF